MNMQQTQLPRNKNMSGKIQLLMPDINDKGIDSRGAIYSYVPYDKIVEFVVLSLMYSQLEP